jgi:uncharacterized protein (DUF58 family)
VAVEIAAALAAGAIQRGEPVGLLTADCHLAPSGGGAQLERILDELARAHFRTGAPRLAPPVPPRECALVTTAQGGDAGWGDVFLAERGGR